MIFVLIDFFPSNIMRVMNFATTVLPYLGSGIKSLFVAPLLLDIYKSFYQAFGFFVPYLERDLFLSSTPRVSLAPLMM